jgi:hypothetical protein
VSGVGLGARPALAALALAALAAGCGGSTDAGVAQADSTQTTTSTASKREAVLARSEAVRGTPLVEWRADPRAALSAPQDLSPRFGVPQCMRPNLVLSSEFEFLERSRPVDPLRLREVLRYVGQDVDLQGVCDLARAALRSPLPDSNRGPPPYHGGFALPLGWAGIALAKPFSLHSPLFRR